MQYKSISKCLIKRHSFLRYLPECLASVVGPLRPPFLVSEKNKYQHFGSIQLIHYVFIVINSPARMHAQISYQTDVSLSLSVSAAPYDIPTCMQQKLKKITADKVLTLRRHVE